MQARLDSRWFASILNRMVKYQDEVLDRTFAALSDPTRRALLARLGDRESLSVSELAQPFSISLPAIIKHLDVLSDAGLIAREKTGRTVACRLTASPMEQAMDWLNRYQRFWSDDLDRLAAFLEEDRWPPSQALVKPKPARDAELAARPSLTLNRRLAAAPEKVYAAWADPEKLVQWFGPALGRGGLRARPTSICASAAATASASTPTANITRSAASIARSCRTSGWFSPGRGIPRRSVNRW